MGLLDVKPIGRNSDSISLFRMIVGWADMKSLGIAAEVAPIIWIVNEPRTRSALVRCDRPEDVA